MLAVRKFDPVPRLTSIKSLSYISGTMGILHAVANSPVRTGVCSVV